MSQDSNTTKDPKHGFRFRLRGGDGVKSRRITATEFLRQFSKEEGISNEGSSSSSYEEETINIDEENYYQQREDVTPINETNVGTTTSVIENNDEEEPKFISQLSQVVDKTPPNTQRTYDSEVDTIPLHPRSKRNTCMELIIDLILFGYKAKHEQYTWKQISWKIGTGIIDILLMVGFSALWSYIFILPYCGFLFQCGCTWPWKGGADHCNVNNPNLPKHDKCPFCAGNPILIWIFVLLGHGVAMTIVGLLSGSLSWRLWLRKKRESVFYEPGFTKPLLSQKENSTTHATNRRPNDTARARVTVRHDKQVQFITWWIIITILLRLVVSIVTFFVYGFFMALIFKWAYHYPKFVI